MRRTIWLAVLGMCASILASAALCAELESAKQYSAGPERKRPSSACRPKKQSPAEQFAYANSLRDAGRLSQAAAQYRVLVPTWHDSPEAPAAQFEYARLLEKKGDYSAAFDEYEYLIYNFMGGFPYNEVLDSQFRIANLVMTSKSRFLWIFPTSGRLEAALPLFEKIVLNGPRWSRTAEAQFNIGWIREQIGSCEEAILAYEITRQNYPGTPFATDAAFRQGYCLYAFARKNSREERGFQAARTHLQRFIRDYPHHESVGEASRYLEEITSRLSGMAYQRALFYDRTGGRPRAALIAYSDFLAKFPSSGMAQTARKRIEELKAVPGVQPSSDAGEGERGQGEHEGNDSAVGNEGSDR